MEWPLGADSHQAADFTVGRGLQSSNLYRLRYLGHRIEPYAALATG